MYNAEKIKVTVTYFDGVDEYGQMNEDVINTKVVEGAFGLMSQSPTGDYRYLDATHYFLTQDKTINDTCVLTIGGHDYKVKYTNPHKRLNEVFLT